MIKRQTRDSVTGTLTDVPVGSQARVATLDALSSDYRVLLQACGLGPGDWVNILQHSPVTVVQVEQTELAFEAEIASKIRAEWSLSA